MPLDAKKVGDKLEFTEPVKSATLAELKGRLETASAELRSLTNVRDQYQAKMDEQQTVVDYAQSLVDKAVELGLE